ncbi:MAG: NHLP bacteriocin system secretion protein [Alphaproteobacteria bacterium]|nr:NHLP bacteriocin system secretion protein [Alphaproteobacteria bacterium]
MQTEQIQIQKNKYEFELTGPKAPWIWGFLLFVSMSLLLITIWGFFGNLSENVSGSGMTISNGGIHPIVSGQNGVLSHLNIVSGSKVNEGQILGYIYNPETLFGARQQRNEFENLSSEILFLEEGTKRLTKYQNDLETEKKNSLDTLKLQQEKSKKRAEEIAGLYKELRSIGSASKITYYQALDQMLQTESSFLQTMFQSMEADISVKERLWNQEEKLLTLRRMRENKLRDLKLYNDIYKEASWITSNFDGQVLEVFKEEGAYVEKGEKIALLSSGDEKGIYLVAFIPSSYGKKVKNGMSAFFSPDVAPAAEYGYIHAIVQDVSSVPVNADTVRAELMNDVLTQKIVEDDAVMRIVLEIVPDEMSESGYKWTTKKGWPFKIVAGMQGSVIVNTGYRSPMSYVIPSLRKVILNKKNAGK